MALRPQTVETLTLFIDKANELKNSSFVKYVFESGEQFHLSYNVGEPVVITWNPPATESIKAFVLTLRFFIQDNERISLRALERVLDDSEISLYWRERYTVVRSELNEILDTPPQVMNPEWEGRKPTRREIMETFVYGELAHATPDKRRRYDAWKTNQIHFSMYSFNFVRTLRDIVSAISYIARLSELELRGALQGKSSDANPDPVL